MRDLARATRNLAKKGNENFREQSSKSNLLLLLRVSLGLLSCGESSLLGLRVWAKVSLFSASEKAITLAELLISVPTTALTQVKKGTQSSWESARCATAIESGETIQVNLKFDREQLFPAQGVPFTHFITGRKEA